MNAAWFSTHPITAGMVTFALVWSDWLLTICQQQARDTQGPAHTRTYPVDTIEGNPLLRSAVERRRWFNPLHLLGALFVSAATSLGLLYAPAAWRLPLLGYVWGLFLIVDLTHLGNLIGYRVCRRGTHGTVWLHQRTAYLVQMGRYVALAALLIVLALLSGSPFMGGVAIAAVSSVFRQAAWLRRVPAIAGGDPPPGVSDATPAPPAVRTELPTTGARSSSHPDRARSVAD